MSLCDIIFCIFFFVLSITQAERCHGNQKESLLQFRNESFEHSSLLTWKADTDCCSWIGITCDSFTGKVIGLQLRGNARVMRLKPDSSLFDLITLQRLDLSPGGAKMASHPQILIPSTFEKLTNLTYLSLHSSGFSGKVPLQLLRLTKLVSLDLSDNDLYLENANDLKILTQNMTRLEELRLSDVQMSSVVWSTPLSNFVPYLRVLTLANCSISGEMLLSLSNLRFISVIVLSWNNLSAQVPEFFGKLSSLKVLKLLDCDLQGEFPDSILKLPYLESLYLSGNRNLYGSLLHLPINIQNLYISETNFHGNLPESIGNLHSLNRLSLRNCNFFGKIPNAIRNLSELDHMDLSSNNFHGLLPSFENCFQKLVYLNIGNNSFDGMVPFSLFTLLSLQFLYLDRNLFVSLATEIPGNISSSQLELLDLSNNQINGHIPKWIWSSNLTYLTLSHNLLTDIDLPLPEVRHLKALDLSSNNLNGLIPFVPSSSPLFLDYSNNNFTLFIPSENIALYLSNAEFFSVSRNRLVGELPESICSSQQLNVLDLSDNKLTGKIPACLGNFSQYLLVLNLGENRFSGEMPLMYTKSLRSLVFKGNMLNGTVPRSLTDCTLLEVLDLGNNQIRDTFPFWLDNLPNMRVLVLKSNSFHGHIGYGRTKTPFPKLHVIDISSNRFTGLLPSEYFSKWKGMTEIQTSSTQAQYLVINAYYHDSVTVTMKGYDMLLSRILTIFSSFDVSNNKLEGVIGDFGELKSLIVLNLSHNSVVGSIPSSLEKLIRLESLDLSKNMLTGEIPQALTSLTFLSVLDLSGNRLEGTIPQGRQFNTFPSSCYEGNDGLCGYPLFVKCRGYRSSDNHQESKPDSESLFDMKFLAMGYGSGLVVGLSTGYIFVSSKNGCLTKTKRMKRNRFGR